MGEVRIPSRLAATVVAWEGDSGRRWLEQVPRLVAEVAEAWDLEVGPALEPGGNISWVAPARRRSDGLEAVLKVQHPHPESAPEASGLSAWAGDGAVRLFAQDPMRCALLLERCRPGTALLEEAGSRAAVTAGAALGARLHLVEAPVGLPTLAAVLATWADELEARLARRPLADPGLGRRALSTMRDRPATSRAVLLHGDLNPTNVLAAEREPWLAIDPKPMLGDPAYDGPRLVLQPHPLDAAALAERLALVAESLEVEREALVEWCLVNAVEMAASSADHGDGVTTARCLAQVTLLVPHLT